MTLPLSPVDLDDRNLYPLHEEDDVPEIPFHERVVRYLRDAIAAFAPHWFVTGNACIYWERGNFRDYAAPDVFVVKEPLPEPMPRVYHLWRDPPVSFVAEVGSRSTLEEETTRLMRYRDRVRVPEHLFFDPDSLELRLRRLGPSDYEEVAPGPNGRLRSEQLGLEFELDTRGFLWVYTPEGERLMTHEEEVARRREVEALAAEEARQREAAETRADAEARQRHEAETRANVEARQRHEAETRAAEEARLREAAETLAREAERRAAEEAARREELERRLAAMRARFPDADDGNPSPSG
jgi:Uma2 family endonuclease